MSYTERKLPDPAAHHDQLTATGPYAGTLSAFTTGTKLRTRYSHLIPSHFDQKTSLWACDSNRVVQTARYFSAGFFGLDWASTAATLHVVSENPDLGADTLTPGDTCLEYRNDTIYGHDFGLHNLIKFRHTYLPAIMERLHGQTPGITFSEAEVYSMQEMCGFEILVRGSSPWCDVFTHEEWLAFEYARDLLHWYRAGPGNRFSGTMGWLWLNATANLLRQGPRTGNLFFSLCVPKSGCYQVSYTCLLNFLVPTTAT